jgi:ABC-2 type transport system permease protein
MTTIAAQPTTRLTTTGIVRSEWIKLRTLRSTFWMIGVAMAVTVGFGTLMSFMATTDLTVIDMSDEARGLANIATIGIQFSQLVFAVLGVLVITGEYATGMIRSTLTAVPRRLRALFAKALVLFVVTFGTSTLAAVLAFAVAYGVLAGEGLSVSILHPTVVSMVLGSSLYLALLALFALGVGALLRSSAGGIATVLGIMLLLPTLLALIPVTWINDLGDFLVTSAGVNMSRPEFSSLEPWQNLLVLLAWVAVALGGAALSLARRDA